MSLFEPIKLTWKGGNYEIPARNVLKAIAKVEEIITLQRLNVEPQDVPIARLSMAYGVILRFAGAPAEDDEVYEAMVGGESRGGAAIEMVQALLLMMLPKRVRDKLEAEIKAEQPVANAGGNEEAATTKAS